MTAHASGETVLTAISILVAFTVLVVVVRLYTRIWLVRNGGIDDWLIVASLVFTIGMTIGIGFQVRYGLGEPVAEQTPKSTKSYKKAFWSSIWLYHLAIGLARVSVVYQCMRIFPQATWGPGRWVMRSMLLVNSIFTVWATFSSAFTCVPVNHFWETESQRKCLNMRVLWLCNSSMAMILDLLVATLPLPWIRQLQLPFWQKIQVVCLFVLAGLPCILAIIRLQALIQVAENAGSTWDNAILAVFSANEVYVSIVCASLPSLKAWYNRIIKPHVRSSRQRVRSRWPCSSTSSNSRLSSIKAEGIFRWFKRRLRISPARNSTISSGILGNPWESSIELMNRPRVPIGHGIHVVQEIDQRVEIQTPDGVVLKNKPVSVVEEHGVQHIEDGGVRCGVLPSVDQDATRVDSSLTYIDSHHTRD